MADIFDGRSIKSTSDGSSNVRLIVVLMFCSMEKCLYVISYFPSLDHPSYSRLVCVLVILYFTGLIINVVYVYTSDLDSQIFVFSTVFLKKL